MNIFGSSEDDAQAPSEPDVTKHRQMTIDSDASTESHDSLPIRTKKPESAPSQTSSAPIHSSPTQPRPLRLLDLPYDCLKLIFDKVRSCSDMGSFLH